MEIIHLVQPESRVIYQDVVADECLEFVEPQESADQQSPHRWKASGILSSQNRRFSQIPMHSYLETNQDEKFKEISLKSTVQQHFYPR